MALIHCASCSKRISNKAKSCPHCGYTIGGADQQEQLERRARITKIEQGQRLMTHSFLSLLIFVAGFAVWYWYGEPAQGLRGQIGITLIAIGFIGYLITRVRTLLAKRKLKC